MINRVDISCRTAGKGKIRRRIAGALVTAGASLVLLLGCNNSGPSGPSGFIDIGDNDPSVVLASGDSVTVGADSSSGQGYRPHLQSLLAQQSKTVTVVNGGRSGVVSGNIHLVLADIARYRPAVVVLQYGVNDSLVVADTTPPGVVENIRQMVYGTLDNKSIVVLTTLTPTCGFRTEQNDMIRQINEGIRELMPTFGEDPAVVLADVGEAFAREDPAGGGCRLISSANYNHPNDTGYRLMASVIAEAMEPLTW